ncbi:MAG TPA: tetratricopeptide repeat protein [Gemmatimonadales bacterium]|nr:tetratricopeptide repeat protein [Gemmatimonadales bacterium]
MRRLSSVAFAVAALAAPLVAQLPEADQAFQRGDYAMARAAYERALARDSLTERALYRLAILDSWDGKLARSLTRFNRLRRLDPRDPDIMVSNAQVLAWAGQTRASEALYDSVLARAPDRADAQAGRARAVAWSGDLDRAEELWRKALERHPDDPELLIGLAQTLYWKGQPGLAEAYAARARALAPEDRTARDLARLLRAALRPEVATSVDGATDSDDNDFVAQEGTVATALGSRVRTTLGAGWRRGTDPLGRGLSYGARSVFIAALGQGAVLRAGVGVRRVEADTGPSHTPLPAHTPLTAELGIGLRPARYAAVSLGYSRTSFDETAGLMRQDLTIDALDVSFDVSPRPGWSVSGGGGGAWFSDVNRRFSAVAAVLARVAKGLEIGPFARVMGYRYARPGLYFTPVRFSVIEGRAVYQWQRNRWGLRADGGLGSQQVQAFGVPAGAPHQTEWHAGVSLSRGWGANNEIALVGSITNSGAATNAAHITTESFRYRTLGVRFRQGL